MGNASEVEAGKLQTAFAQVLAAGVDEGAYQLVPDSDCTGRYRPHAHIALVLVLRLTLALIVDNAQRR